MVSHPPQAWICRILFSTDQPSYSCCPLCFTQHNYFSFSKTAEVQKHDKYVGIVGNNYNRNIHTSSFNSSGSNERISISVTFLNCMTIRSKMLTQQIDKLWCGDCRGYNCSNAEDDESKHDVNDLEDDGICLSDCLMYKTIVFFILRFCY